MSFSLPEYTKNDVGWGLAPSWFQKGRFAAGGMEGREGLGKGEREGRGKAGSWGIAPWLLGDRRPCLEIGRRYRCRNACHKRQRQSAPYDTEEYFRKLIAYGNRIRKE